MDKPRLNKMLSALSHLGKKGEPIYGDAGRALTRLMQQAVQFDLPNGGVPVAFGQVEQGIGAAGEAGELRAPFPTCLFYFSIEIEGAGFDVAAFATLPVGEGNNVPIAYYAICGADDSVCCGLISAEFDEGKVTMERDGEGVDNGSIMGTLLVPVAVMQSVLKFLYYLHCGRVRTTDTWKATTYEKAMAAGRREIPLFERHTVEIDITAPIRCGREHQGGHHASPRTHLRRGHWSVSKLGKRYWRSASVIKGDKGMIVKNYNVVPKEV